MFAITTRRSTDGLGPDLVGLRNRINWFFDSPSGITAPVTGNTNWTPAMDLFEDADSYQLFLDVPGVNADEIELTLEDHVLTIHGRKTGGMVPDGYRALRRERGIGTFERQFTLPGDVDENSIQATYDSGVLQVTIRKPERARARQIPVSVSANG